MAEELSVVQTGQGAADAFDVTIVLNLHDEARYLLRTMASLEEAVLFAKGYGVRFEIVVVLDNADAATVDLASAYDYSTFDASQVLKVRNGSLGLSRNDGIDAARGAYIATADADDLVSFDYFYKLYMTALSRGPKCLVFPEYHFGFGVHCYAWKFHGQDRVGSAVFYEQHPYGSRVMFRRADFNGGVRYADASLKSGYAYEDWHFNCECLAAGFSIHVASGTVVFYRQRAGSLLRRADAETTRKIPPSRYFEPDVFIRLAWPELADGKVRRLPDPHFTRDEFRSIPGMVEVIAAANRIDPAISLGLLHPLSLGANLLFMGPAPRAYFELCQLVVGQRFTDVVLVPFMTRGGAEKYILSVLNGLKELDPEARFLVLGGQPFPNHSWIERLPEGSLFVDLYRLSVQGLNPDVVGDITFRIIQNLSSVRRLHFKISQYADTLAKKYLGLFGGIEKYVYYFCDDCVISDGFVFTNGHGFDLISEHGRGFSSIVSDHARALDDLGSAIGDDVRSKSQVLYTHCAVPADSALAERPHRRLLWASRLDAQKRPELLVAIARRLAVDLPDVVVHVHGSMAGEGEATDIFAGADNIVYHGPFDGFQSTNPARYDALIYTSLFDGLPNIVLEAMAEGLPVVAPAIGGIPEVLGPDTGYVIEDDPDEDVLAGRYVFMLRELYANWDQARQRSDRARSLLAERHSKDAFMKRLGEIFLRGATEPGT